jgi:hypothetical protein
MRSLGVFAGAWLAANLLIQGAAQDRRQTPYLEFGSVRVSLGMTVEQVGRIMAADGMHLGFLDGQTALVTRSTATGPNSDMGQVTFRNGLAAYAAFQFPGTNDAVVLAQELAGAIENVDARSCSLKNFTAHGTGGSHTDSIFDCGSKTIRVVTVQTLTSDNASTLVEVEIGTP